MTNESWIVSIDSSPKDNEGWRKRKPNKTRSRSLRLNFISIKNDDIKVRILYQKQQTAIVSEKKQTICLEWRFFVS